ncbi:MAG TPA: hypothetical protein VFQ61_18005 [Polyangiaceae bacterium]|nr:hypothetical protein [Polyangiaceae bacterium]
MTAPRQILPGSTYFVTRRCTQRMFLLKPSPETNSLILYCLAEAAEETGVILHAVCFMSNHWHGVLSDPFARLPEFLERFHRRIARALNVVLDRRENFWSSEKTTVILLATERDIVDRMAYTLANPTAAGLVSSPADWPGIISRNFEKVLRVEMPEILAGLQEGGPDLVHLSFMRPPAYQSLSNGEFSTLLDSLVIHRVRRAHAEMRRTGQQFLGAKQVLKQSAESKPTTPGKAPLHGLPVAASDPKIREVAVFKLKKFLHAYREAFRSWCRGERHVAFPFGTYALRVHFGIPCAPPAPS